MKIWVGETNAATFKVTKRRVTSGVIESKW